MAGLVPEGVAQDLAAALYANRLAWAAEAAAAAGVRLAIEAINRHDIPGYFLRTQEQAAALVAAVGPRAGRPAVRRLPLPASSRAT